MHYNFELFDFQAVDVDKLASQKSRLVGNDMGTGKTYIGIALDLENRQGAKHHKTLVICPKSVIDVWDKHCMDLTDLGVYVIDPKNRQKFLDNALNPRKGGYFICHWDALRLLISRRKHGPNNLTKVRWFHIIGDEIHRAKNRKAQATRALKTLKTTYKTGMSGTPADNKPQDIWSILNWLFPAHYTSYWRFVKQICILEKDEEDGYLKMVGIDEHELAILHKAMKPWYVRRRKEDVLKDLPPKYYTTLWSDLTPRQRTAYNSMKKTMVAWVNEHEDELEAGDPIIAQAVISQLVRLQQYAVAYVVPKKDEDGENVYRWDKKSEEWKQVFVVTEPSSKLDVLMEILEDSDDEQIVVWSQFKSVVKLLEARLVQKGISHALLTGDVSQADRAKAIEDFQAGRIRVFTGTIAAGGVGITLTAASTVVFLDRAWSPSINLQAEDRLHRIGQKNAVQVIDICARNTVDLGRRQQLEKKLYWIRMILGDKVSPETILKHLEKEG